MEAVFLRRLLGKGPCVVVVSGSLSGSTSFSGNGCGSSESTSMYSGSANAGEYGTNWDAWMLLGVGSLDPLACFSIYLIMVMC